MLNRGFVTSLFNMVPKFHVELTRRNRDFETSSFNIVPKG